LKLWTIQRYETWEEFQERGILRADGRRADSYLRSAYRWMMEQMKKRLPSYTGRYPIWAWYQPKPDLRSSGYLAKGTRGIRIEFQVPESRVLLSDFDAWHIVLNQGYLSLTEEEDEAWEKRLPSQKHRYDELSRSSQLEIKQSWERIFDLDTLASSQWVSSGRYIQAVLEEISLGEVVRVKPFTAR